MDWLKTKAYKDSLIKIYNDIKNGKLKDETIAKTYKFLFFRIYNETRLTRVLHYAQAIRDGKVTLEEFLNTANNYQHELFDSYPKYNK